MSIPKAICLITVAHVGGGYSTLSICLLTPNLCLNSFFLKSKQAASLKLGNLKQKVVLYKTGKFLQASVAETAFKFENKKNLMYRSCMKDF